jgi:hypothetical protein
MKRAVIWVLSLLGFFSSGCEFGDLAFNSERIQGSGRLAQESRNVHGFNKVSLQGFGELTISQGNKESLTVEADDNILPKIKTVVEDGKLVIGMERGVSISTHLKLRYTLTVAEIDCIELSGSGKVISGPLNSSDFRVRLPGSGEIHIESLDADSLDATISGSGTIDLAGKVDRQAVHISGSGKTRAPDLQSHAAEASISGSGSTTLWAQDSLSARISGSGSVGYYGSASVTKSVSGSGSVRHLGDK